jgi:hypothetical protein
MSKVNIFISFFFVLSFQVYSEDNLSSHTPYWSGERVTKSSSTAVYTTSMHELFGAISDNYKEGGIYYYRDGVNSFGQKEPINTREEVIFCESGDVTFTDVAFNSLKNTSSALGDGKSVQYDSASFGSGPSGLQGAVLSGLVNNSSTNTKGRFCYRESDTSVSYRSAGAESAVYCPKNTIIPNYTDYVSGMVCRLTLDLDLKEGEVRFLKQLGITSDFTIAQGFVSCEKNEVGDPVLSLVENGDGCSKLNRESCNYSCDWAQDVACMSIDMPAWGGGNCKSQGTVIFEGESIDVKSSSSLSRAGDGFQWEGDASMKCAKVSGTASWVIESQSCEKKNF